jgi:transposase
MLQTVYAGVDVSSASLTLVTLGAERQPTAARDFANTPAGQRRLLKQLRQLGGEVHVCLEPTSCYHLALCRLLHAAAHVSVSVINPRAVRDFARSMMQRAKTDPCDACVLARYGQAHQPAAWQPPRDIALALRSLSRRLEDLVARATALKNQRHSARRAAFSPYVLKDIELELKAIERRQARLEQEAGQLIESDAQLRQRFALLLSVKGVAAKSALRLLAELSILPAELGKKQWVASAGLDPVPHDSGKSLKAPRHISKQGNTHLRLALLMPALSALRHCPQVKAYYERLLARSRCAKLAAVCAVMRKLLQAIWGMFQTQTAFNPQLFSQA